jgi:hypothetical protein
MDARTIRFYKNGKAGPIAFKKLPTAGQLYPLVWCERTHRCVRDRADVACSIYNSNAVASITAKPVPAVPAGKGKGKAAAAAASSDSESESGSSSEASGTEESASEEEEASGSGSGAETEES